MAIFITLPEYNSGANKVANHNYENNYAIVDSCSLCGCSLFNNFL